MSLSSRAQVRRSRQLFLGCVAGSLMLHLAVLTLLPELRRDSPPLPARALDVALVRVDPPQPLPAAAPEAKLASAATPRRPAAPAPNREEAPKPELSDQPSLALSEARPSAESTMIVAVPAIGQAESSAVTEPPAAAAASRDRVLPPTPPGFNAEYLRNPAPRYPLIARRNGEQGTVTLRLLVTREGVPVQVSVEKSSGSAHLDGAALDAVKTWRFVPARRGAEAVEAWVLVPVVFKLEGVS
ncbi:MAG: energy transducer TonB [Betaproteobacteria bacterium]|nr:energy transducer TonB [Betaproteobacteria bacterium]